MVDQLVNVNNVLASYVKDFEFLFAVKPEQLLGEGSINKDTLHSFLEHYNSLFVLSSGTCLQNVTREQLESNVTLINVYAIGYTTYLKIKKILEQLKNNEENNEENNKENNEEKNKENNEENNEENVSEETKNETS